MRVEKRRPDRKGKQKSYCVSERQRQGLFSSCPCLSPLPFALFFRAWSWSALSRDCRRLLRRRAPHEERASVEKEKKRMATAFFPLCRSSKKVASFLILLSLRARSLCLLPSLSPNPILTLACERAPLEHGHGLAAESPPPQRRVQPDGGVEDVRQCERGERRRVGGVAEREPSCGEGPHSCGEVLLERRG